MREMGWILDEARFLIYLSEKYGVAKAYYFLGYMKSNEEPRARTSLSWTA